MRREEQQEQTDMPDPFKFVEQKIKAAELEKVRDNWKRKIEIAAVAAKKARAVIRANDNYINDLDINEVDYGT